MRFLSAIFFVFLLMPRFSHATEINYENDYSLGEVQPIDASELADKIKSAEKDQSLQYILGYIYQYGQGVKEDEKKAEEWYTKSAISGNSRAMVALAKLYRRQNTTGALSKAFSWLNRAAKKDEPYSWFELGILYEKGLGVFQDYKKAFSSYQKAADKGVLNAHMKLGLFYQNGIGTEKNIRMALEHYTILEKEADDKDVKQQISGLLANIYLVMATEEEDEEKKFKLYKLAAEYGDNNSQTIVADAYRNGKGVAKDYEQAVKWYKLVAERKNTYAMESLGYLYSNGLGEEKNYVEALKWYKLAAEEGSADAAWNIGGMYYNGYGVRQDLEEAKRWYNLSELLAEQRK